MKWNNHRRTTQAQSLESLIEHGVPKTETRYLPREIDQEDLGDGRYISWRKFRLLSDNWWLQEFLAWFASFVFIAAIFGVLLGYNQRPLPEWPYSITLNTLLSLLAQLAKGCLLIPIASALGQIKWIWFTEDQQQLGSLGAFDGANAGLLGGLQLLYTLRGRWLGSLGAILAILILGLEIFTQQAVTYSFRQVESDNATIPITNGYGDYQFYDDQDLGIRGNYQFYMEQATTMNAAMLNGIVQQLSSNSFDTLAFTCPSGNCTYPIYSTLAVCGECADLSDSGTRVCVERKHGLSTECEWTIPNDQISIHAVDQTPEWWPDDMGHYNSTVMPTSRSTNFKDIGSYITAFSMAAAAIDSEKWLATECVLFWCVQTLNTSITQGFRSEEILAYVYNTTNNAPTIIPGEQALPSNWSLNNAIINGTYVQSIEINTHNDTVFNGNSSFTVDPLANFTISTALAQWLVPQSWDNISSVQLGFNSTGCLSSTISQLYTYPSSQNSTEVTKNTSALVSALALSMTNAIRMTYISEGSNSFGGTSWIIEVHVDVRWEWLLYSVILNLLALFFLLAVMIKTRSSNTKIWKSDPLALIFHGLDHGTQVESGNKETISEMRELAEKLPVKLVPTRNGSKLSMQPIGI